MILIEQTQVPETDLPVAEFREHLQLGTGFADDGLQDAVLTEQLRAALAVVEERTGKALIARDFLLVIHAWRNLSEQVLPTAPVSSVESFSVTDLSGESSGIASESYHLRRDGHSPALVAAGYALPTIPVGGTGDIVFRAGYGLWGDVPADLRQAVLLLAAHFYEHRGAAGTRRSELPMGVAAICRRHAPMRLVGARRI